MKRRRILACSLGFLATGLLVLGFQAIAPAPANARSTTLLVAAAASLQDALKQIEPLFKSANQGIKVNYNFAASGSLQQQIEQGAPVDLFICAATKQMDALQKKNLILTDTRRNILTNSLELVVPRHSTLGITSFEQLTNPKVKRISIGEPRSVPAGQYAEEVFKKLGIWEPLQPKFVYGNSVRNVLGTVESGNADAGVVYCQRCLDTYLRNQVKRQLVETLSTYPGVTLFVTHNIEEAYRVCEKLMVMLGGKPIAFDSKHRIFEHPRTLRIAQLTGCKNFSRAVAVGANAIAAIDWGVTLQVVEAISDDLADVGIRAQITLFLKLQAVPTGSQDDRVQAEILKRSGKQLRIARFPGTCGSIPCVRS